MLRVNIDVVLYESGSIENRDTSPAEQNYQLRVVRSKSIPSRASSNATAVELKKDVFVLNRCSVARRFVSALAVRALTHLILATGFPQQYFASKLVLLVVGPL